MDKGIKNILLAFAILGTLTGCDGTRTTPDTSASNFSSADKRDLKILTTNPVLKHLINELDNGEHEVDCLVTSERIMNSYSPDLDQIRKKGYNAIFYMGVGYEPFMKSIIDSIDMNSVDVVNVARGIDIKRYKSDKIELENYYYLTNSENYQIALFSVKNSLQELDLGRASIYDENYLKISRDIDGLQNQIKTLMDGNPNVYFVCDNDLLQYFCQEYRREHVVITEFRREMEDPATSRSSQAIMEDRIIFLYTDDMSLRKFADDITEYKMRPVKITLYDYKAPMIETYKKNYDSIKKVVDVLRIESSNASSTSVPFTQTISTPVSGGQ